MRPTDGYGGSMAMEDAVVLTRILRDGIRNSVSVEEMLERFEKERLSRVKRPGPQSISLYLFSFCFHQFGQGILTIISFIDLGLVTCECRILQCK